MKNALQTILLLLLLVASATALPAIANVTSANVTTSKADIFWQTNGTSYYNRVYYGLPRQEGSYVDYVANTTNASNHDVSLIGLQERTLYNYRVQSCDNGTGAGNCTNSSVYEFQTLVDCTTGSPAISCDTIEGLPSAGTDLGDFMANLAPGIGQLVLIIGLFLGVVAIVAGAAVVVTKTVNGFKWGK